MSNNKFFPKRPDSNPTIYVYELIGVQTHIGLLKVGYTVRASEKRIDEQTKTAGIKYKILLEESAMRSDGSAFIDKDVHRLLRKNKIKNPEGEWFKCSLKEIQSALIEIKSGIKNEDNRTLDFAMRPEQVEAVDKTIQ